MPGQASSRSGLRVEKSGTGAVLLCLHGLGGGSHWFRGLARCLEDRHRVVSLDLPGTGANREGNDPFSIPRCVAAVHEILEEEQGPVALLGHSLGTLLALKACVEAPARIASLLLVCGLPSVTAAIRTRLSARREIILRQGMAGLGWTVAEGVFSQQSLRAAPETAALFARLVEAYPPAAYVETLDALLGASAEDTLDKVEVPCLVLTGGEDAYTPPAETRRFADALRGPVRRVVLEGCGHMPFLETPDRFAREVADFLAARA